MKISCYCYDWNRLKWRKRGKCLPILTGCHVTRESSLLAHVESNGTNSLVHRKVFSAIILDDFHVFLSFVPHSLSIDFTSIFYLQADQNLNFDWWYPKYSFELSINTTNLLFSRWWRWYWWNTALKILFELRSKNIYHFLFSNLSYIWITCNFLFSSHTTPQACFSNNRNACTFQTQFFFHNI